MVAIDRLLLLPVAWLLDVIGVAMSGLGPVLPPPGTRERRTWCRRMRAVGRCVSLGAAGSSCAVVLSIWRLLGSANPVPPPSLALTGVLVTLLSMLIFMLTAKCDLRDPESNEVSIKVLQFDLLWVLMTALSTILLFISSKIRYIAVPCTLSAGLVATLHSYVILKTGVMELYGELSLTMREVRDAEPLRPGEKVYVEGEPYRKQRNGGTGVLLGRADPDEETNKDKDKWRVEYKQGAEGRVAGVELWRDEQLHHIDETALSASWLLVIGSTFFLAWLLLGRYSEASPPAAAVHAHAVPGGLGRNDLPASQGLGEPIDAPLWCAVHLNLDSTLSFV
jgi:hypothetical protein